MKTLSRLLTGLMLALAALLLLVGLLAGTLLYLEHPSFAAALLAALVFLGLLLLLRRQRQAIFSFFRRLGSARSAILLAFLCLLINGLPLLFLHLTPEGDYSVFWQTACLFARRAPLPDNLHLYLCLFPHLMGYSGFLAPFLRLFGESTAVPVLWNLVFTCLSCLLIFRLCLVWRGMDAAATAALCWILLPSKLLYNAMVLSEPFYTFLLLLFLYLTQLSEQSRSLPAVLGLGALAGLTLRLMNLARPIAAVPLIAAVIWVLLLRGEEMRRRELWLHRGAYLALLLAAYLALGPVSQRFLTGVLGETPSSFPGYNIYVGFNPDTCGGYSEEDMVTFGDVLHGPGEEDVNQTQHLMLDLALERAASVDLPRLLLGKLRIFLGRDESAAYHASQALSPLLLRPLLVACNAWYYLLILLSVSGLWRLWRQREHSAVLLVPLYLIGLTLAQMLAEVSDRYHYSILPILAILAACSCEKKENRP